jgi:hypothetical protein
MARISQYTNDATITDGDKLLGTDAAGKATKNYTLGSIKTFMEENAEFSSSTTVVDQGTAATNWVINHNLNKYPSVWAKNSAGDQIIGQIVYTNLNSLTLVFSAATSGTAYLN